jgi:hypothetical protein
LDPLCDRIHEVATSPGGLENNVDKVEKITDDFAIQIFLWVLGAFGIEAPGEQTGAFESIDD